MGMQDPKVITSTPFGDTFQEGDPFTLLGAETVEVKNTEHGSGEMAVLKIATDDGPKYFSIWGVYINAQVKAATHDDFGKQYRVVREVVSGYSERPVKAIRPVSIPAAPVAEEATF